MVHSPKIFSKNLFEMLINLKSPKCLELYVVREGPLEKLWGGGGSGIFEPQEIFFVIKFLVWIFFRPLHEYFLGLIGVQEFF